MQDFAPRFAPLELRRRWITDGLWNDDTLATVVADGAARHATTRARVLSQTRPYDGTVRDLADQGGASRGGARAARDRHRRRGRVPAPQLARGDRVDVRTPARGSGHGADRAHLRTSRDRPHPAPVARRALITADHFGEHDYLAELAELDGALPDLEMVIVVDAHGAVPRVGPASLTWGEAMAAGDPIAEPAVLDPDSPAVVNYTSGTTSAAKGVVHSHRTFLAELRQGVEEQRGIQAWFDWAGTRERIAPAPIGHMAGMLSVLGPIVAGRTLHILDRWDPGLVLRTMTTEGLAPGSGATVFLTSLLEHPDFDAAVHAPLMARMGLGGAPIPAEVARRASELGISLVRGYGSTEHPSITMTSHADPDEPRVYTDGCALAGVEMRLVDDDGREVGVGSPGEILARGPDLFIGYVDPALTPTAIDPDGWFATGDIGILDERRLPHHHRPQEGHHHPRRREHQRERGRGPPPPGPGRARGRGGRGTRPRATASTDARSSASTTPPVGLALAQVRAHLEESGLARQKWPEELRVLDEFPRTPSGKIQKHVLRSELRA